MFLRRVDSIINSAYHLPLKMSHSLPLQYQIFMKVWKDGLLVNIFADETVDIDCQSKDITEVHNLQTGTHLHNLQTGTHAVNSLIRSEKKMQFLCYLLMCQNLTKMLINNSVYFGNNSAKLTACVHRE